MIITYPDVSHWQGQMRMDGAAAIVAKATQGTGYTDPAYTWYRGEAARLGVPFAAYHWLDTTDAYAQAYHCYSVVGPHTPLMIDDEQTVINVSHTLGFVSAYRSLGGRVTLEYAPHWVWLNSGQPDLRPLAAAGLALVASWYGAGISTGPGWDAYGGVTPAILQYTNAQQFNGSAVDFNAYRGSISELRALFDGGDTTMPTTAEITHALITADIGSNLWPDELRRLGDLWKDAYICRGQLDQVLAALAADATRDAAMLAAIQALSAGAGVDAEPIIAAIQAAAAETRQLVVDLQARLAAAQRAAADAFPPEA